MNDPAEFEAKRNAIQEMIDCARQRIRIAKQDKNVYTGTVALYNLNREIDCHQDAIIRLTLKLDRLKFKYDVI